MVYVTGSGLIFLHSEAAMPTTSPIIPVVRITRTVPKATCVTLILRPAMNRLSILRE